MSAALDWHAEAAGWPNHAASRFVEAGRLRWHVQRFGAGPVLVLLHGTGASTHSWRDLAPALATNFDVIAPDLPGHAFTACPPTTGLSLAGMARLVEALLSRLGVRPDIVVGHSAGAAVLARMCLDGSIAPRLLVSLNGALLPLSPPYFAPAARLLAALPLVPRLVANYARDGRAVARLIRETGSTLDPQGEAYYTRLMSSPAHVGAVLRMMAAWDLPSLHRELARLRVPLLQIVGANDRTVPPKEAERVRSLVRSARIVTLPGLGHLAHEERPQEVAAIIREAAATLPCRPD